MKIENEWLDAEINMLTLENKQKKKRKISDNFITFKLFLMLTAVFFYAPLIEARCTGKIICFNKNSNSNMAVVENADLFNGMTKKMQIGQVIFIVQYAELI
jgi:hypothetical protein